MSGSPLRTMFMCALIVGAAIAGWKYVGNDKAATSGTGLQNASVSPFQQALQKPGTVIVVHHHRPGNGVSERMARDLAELDRDKYGAEIFFVKQEMGSLPDYEKQAGIRGLDDPAALSFFFNGERVDSIKGDLTKQQMEQKIDEVSRGLIKRMHKGWLPDVPGMTPKSHPEQAPPQKPAKP